MDITPFFGLGVPLKPYRFKDKDRAVRNYVEYMLIRTMSMFDYEGLPDTMPKRALETYLQMNGMVCIFEHEGNLYCSFGGWGGEPDAYYTPTKFIVANPYLDVFKTFTVGEDCVIIRNDSLYKGLRPLFQRYATQLMTNDVSMQLAGINSRIVALIDAPDDRTRESAERVLKKVSDGDLGVIGSNAFLEGIHTEPYATGNHAALISALIELQQYYKASWYNELGLQANYNMKREAINSNESQLNEDALLPLIDDMIACRKEGFERVREMFGVDISVDFGSAWEDNELETAIEQEQLITESTFSNGEQTEIEDSKYLENVSDEAETEINEQADDSEIAEIIEEAIEEVIDLVQAESDSDENSVPDDDNGERDNDGS